MPINVYECLKCGERIGFGNNTINGIAEPKCPKCGDGNLRLIYSLNVTEPSGDLSTNCST